MYIYMQNRLQMPDLFVRVAVLLSLLLPEIHIHIHIFIHRHTYKLINFLLHEKYSNEIPDFPLLLRNY